MTLEWVGFQQQQQQKAFERFTDHLKKTYHTFVVGGAKKKTFEKKSPHPNNNLIKESHTLDPIYQMTQMEMLHCPFYWMRILYGCFEATNRKLMNSCKHCVKIQMKTKTKIQTKLSLFLH